MTIHGFDPTPKAIDFVEKKGVNNFVLHPIGVASSNGFMSFYSPKNPEHVSHSLVENDNNSSKYIKVKVKTIDAIMNELGHKKIDILKMDIEGSEYDVVAYMLDNKIYPEQLLIEFHHRFEPFTINNTIETVNKLMDCSYQITSISGNNQEFSFIRQ
ncbi:FkbM family methyltransferase [Methanolobus mangrovi]|uniref:FkbM family methyltransferase n=1 Tax=Methanolobus mangrovi TaxID=3072977 RepID=A0AA51YGM7_9EURY|nr:FkbM family methyltransferase [Methanolobus mangrovi]WMW22217.1 FkbM family methyltransferase [Methanolobus mangrovi]